MIAYACEGTTWGPRRRAASLGSEMVAVGAGGRAPTLADGQVWRSVRWCSGRPLAGFDVVAGDPSVCVLAEPDAFVLAVTIYGQAFSASCLCERQPDAWWNAERQPLHPWAGRTDWLTRRQVRDLWQVDDETPVIACVDPSWSLAMISGSVRQAASQGHTALRVTDPALLVGADLAIVAAGWATWWEAKACGVPYLALDLGMRDHPRRANMTLRQACSIVGALRDRPDLPDDLVPSMPDHRDEFRAALRCGA